jgi:hypothetical protein
MKSLQSASESDNERMSETLAALKIQTIIRICVVEILQRAGALDSTNRQNKTFSCNIRKLFYNVTKCNWENNQIKGEILA